MENKIAARTIYDASHASTMIVMRNGTMFALPWELPPHHVLVPEAHYKALIEYVRWHEKTDKTP